jgi:hypothetical protein
VDLLAFGRPLIPTAPAAAYESVEVPEFLRNSQDQFRILATESYEYNSMFSGYTLFRDFGPGDEGTIRGMRRSLLPNLCAVEGVETGSNYDPLLDARYLDFRRHAEAAEGDAQKRLLAAMNVRYLVTRQPVANLATVLDRPGMAVNENDAVYPRVRFVSRAAQVARPEEWEEILKGGDFRADCVWLETPPMETGDAGGDAAEVAWTSSPNALSIKATTPGKGYLVFSETYHAGWKAWDNGEPAPVLRADYAFMAVPVAGVGEHAVELRFQPVSWTAGCAISALAFVLTLAALLWPARRRSG